MVSQELLEILRCPHCVQEKDGMLEFYQETWLICQDCGRKYPVKQDIPVMLIDEGTKWMETSKKITSSPSSGGLIYPMSSLDKLLADLTSKDEPRAEAATVQFIHLGEPGFTALTHLSQDPDPDVRWWAIRALSEFTALDASPIFIQALSDSEMEIQACAALGLRVHPNPQAIPKLLTLLCHTDQLLSRLAGNALIAHGFQATQPLIDLINSPENTNQRSLLEAVRALAEIQDPDSISTLFRIYQDGTRLMQHWAEQGLNDMGIGMVFFDPN